MSGTVLSDTAHALGQTPVAFGMLVDVFWKVTIGATGAPTLVAADSSAGVTISRTSAGLYAVTWPNSGGKSVVWQGGSIENDDTTPTAADGAVPRGNAMSATAGTGNIITQETSTATAADPTSGTTLYYKLQIRCGT